MLRALLDPSRRIDYFLAFVFAGWPIALAYLFGIHRRIGSEPGYWDSPNWWSLAILLPVLLFALRWAMTKIAPVGDPWPMSGLPARLPPIVLLVKGEREKRLVYEGLRRRLLNRRNLVITLLVAVFVNTLDIAGVLGPYAGFGGNVHGWTRMFLLDEPPVTQGENLLFIVFAYSVQFSVVFLGVLAIVLFLEHNLFFLGNIYQRRWVFKGEEARFFQINAKDVNRCFGFRVANEAFNTQVIGLMVAGAAMFLSRYASVVADAAGDSAITQGWQGLMTLRFPLAGQWLMALAWLVGLGAISLPALVKLLPLIPTQGGERVERSISNYLREFFSDQAWPKDKARRDEPDERVAARFAENSFWPTGDNRASVLFFFSYWVFLVILVPPAGLGHVQLLIYLVALAGLAYLARLGTFAALKRSLHYVDDLLVTARKDGETELELDTSDPQSDRTRDMGVFVSYRRKDSAPYARSIHQRLLGEFRPDRVFMDVADIAPGEDFAREIDSALDSVDAVIVLIGEKWLTMTDENGRPRIANPSDMVHVEVASALRRGKRVYPVLVGGAGMPKAVDLPDNLTALAKLNAVEVSDSRWDYDLSCLIDAIKAG